MKDLLHKIVNVYEDKGNLYSKVYRYVTMREAENLFVHGELYFTNTSSWATNATDDSGDKLETFFENWWLKDVNLKEYIYSLYKSYCNFYNSLNISHNIEDFIPILSNHLSKYMSIQNETYSYCLTGGWNESAMIDEYHNKWKRNIVFQYKKEFYYDIAIMNQQIRLDADILCADVFKMEYVSSISEFIKELSNKLLNLNLDLQVYNKGTFIKHKRFNYEKEQRIKVYILSSDIINKKCNIGYIMQKLYGSNSIDEIFERSMKMLKEIRAEYLKKDELVNDIKYFDKDNNTKYLVINNICPNIIEKIYVFNDISVEDEHRIYNWANKYGIKTQKLDM